jgi:hypothetical protein
VHVPIILHLYAFLKLSSFTRQDREKKVAFVAAEIFGSLHRRERRTWVTLDIKNEAFKYYLGYWWETGSDYSSFTLILTKSKLEYGFHNFSDTKSLCASIANTSIIHRTKKTTKNVGDNFFLDHLLRWIIIWDMPEDATYYDWWISCLYNWLLNLWQRLMSEIKIHFLTCTETDANTSLGKRCSDAVGGI